MVQDTQRFAVYINVSVRQLSEYPPGSGNWLQAGSNGLEVQDRFDIGSGTFLELAGILGQFHALAERIEAERRA